MSLVTLHPDCRRTAGSVPPSRQPDCPRPAPVPPPRHPDCPRAAGSGILAGGGSTPLSAQAHEVFDSVALLDQCRSANGQEQADAYGQLGSLLYRLLVPRVGSDPRYESLAADAAQEALIAIWRELEAGRGPDDPTRFVSWSVRIAINKLLDMRRRLEPWGRERATKRVAVSRQVRLDEPDKDTGRDLADRIPDAAATELETRAATRELHGVVMSIGGLESVSEASKTVLLKGYLEGWNDEDLADLLDTSKGNIHVIRCRDLQRLRRDEAFMQRLRAVTEGDA